MQIHCQNGFVCLKLSRTYTLSSIKMLHWLDVLAHDQLVLQLFLWNSRSLTEAVWAGCNILPQRWGMQSDTDQRIRVESFLCSIIAGSLKCNSINRLVRCVFLTWSRVTLFASHRRCLPKAPSLYSLKLLSDLVTRWCNYVCFVEPVTHVQQLEWQPFEEGSKELWLSDTHMNLQTRSWKILRCSSSESLLFLICYLDFVFEPAKQIKRQMHTTYNLNEIKFLIRVH